MPPSVRKRAHGDPAYAGIVALLLALAYYADGEDHRQWIRR
jgi:hypothetical protein